MSWRCCEEWTVKIPGAMVLRVQVGVAEVWMDLQTDVACFCDRQSSKLGVEINCLALSISSDFWFNWLVHAIQYGMTVG
jgi:hypothetical protein